MKSRLNVSKHILVPKHAKLSEKEKKELLERLHVSPKDLPVISIKDAAISPLTMKPGDIVKITRTSPTAGETHYYRCVVDG